MKRADLPLALGMLRSRLENAFAPDTAVPGTPAGTHSAGHCAAVSVIVRVGFGGVHVSAIVHGVSHWFNRITDDEGRAWDVDLTGDQFGYPAVQIEQVAGIYPGTRVREPREVNEETMRRAWLLLWRVAEVVPRDV